jgi:hypothetical protein
LLQTKQLSTSDVFSVNVALNQLITSAASSNTLTNATSSSYVPGFNNYQNQYTNYS